MSDLSLFLGIFFFATLHQKRLYVADPILPLFLIRSVYEMPDV